ncbi:MAG: hypothetical protein ABIH23_20885 [bacterium]
MSTKIERREFLQATAAGTALCFAVPSVLAASENTTRCALVSPGCRRSKVRVAKIYMGIPKALWPTPKMDIQEEVAKYEKEFQRMERDFADVDFVVNELVTSQDQLPNLKEKIEKADGVLVIHLSMGIVKPLKEILAMGKPTVLFAAPYSGHEWTYFGTLRNEEEGKLLECLLTSDYDQLAVGIRPIRAIHHLREAKILNVTKRPAAQDYVERIQNRYGTEIKTVSRETVLAAYAAVPDADAKAEAKRWMKAAEKVVEPPEEEIVKSCKLALAFQNMLDEEDATVITADCYGSMYHQLPAFPCIGFTRLNDMGLGGICESDLQSAMTHILFQGLVGKPGFINDPTMDVSSSSIILAHCLGSTRMDGPDGKAAPFKLRTIMERQEGAVPQVRMRIGEKVTQAELYGMEDLLLYFTGEIIDAPDHDRGCRTKITVKIDGDPEKLWQNWSHGLHRVTCYGDLTQDLKRFCRFKGIQMVNEA